MYTKLHKTVCKLLILSIVPLLVMLNYLSESWLILHHKAPGNIFTAVKKTPADKSKWQDTLIATQLYRDVGPWPLTARNAKTDDVGGRSTQFHPQHVKVLPLCPRQPPDLIGDFKENLADKSLTELEAFFARNSTSSQYLSVERGGHYHPTDCTAHQKLAVLIPFRNRHPHLMILLNNLLPVLQRQRLDFRVIIVEQDMPATFNRGMLFNVGFLEVAKLFEFDCVVFHDVDLFPVNDNVFYRCGRLPRHLIAAGSKYNYSNTQDDLSLSVYLKKKKKKKYERGHSSVSTSLPYRRLNGGALMMRREVFTRINGFSNLYFGWGSEDDDIRARLTGKGFNIVRYPRKIGRYFQLIHDRDQGNEENPERMQLALEAGKRQQVEGLNTTLYDVTSVEFKPLYTWISVRINMTKVLRTAPASTQAKMVKLFREAQSFDRVLN